MRPHRFVACLLALLTLGAGVEPALADSPSAPRTANAAGGVKTIVINGRVYGPKDGLEIDTQAITVKHGSGPISVVFGGAPSAPGSVVPMATWGTSYAISTEDFQIHYSGKAKAGGNVFNGKRIIEVCIWYTRGGTQEGNYVCSDADDPNGHTWVAGPEVTTWCWDSLNPLDPPTIFNIATVRILPQVV
jgi:hypothetical protein